MMQELLDRQAVCQRLGISIRTLTRLIGEGQITPVRIGTSVRFAPSDVDSFVQRSRDDRARPEVEAYLRRLEQLVPGFNTEQRQRLVQIVADAA
jgi:excisionase family DNA binding protein